MVEFYCFWTNPYGMIPKRESFTDLQPVLDLVKRSLTQDSDVRGLTVIEGVELSFVPETVVETYRAVGRLDG